MQFCCNVVSYDSVCWLRVLLKSENAIKSLYSSLSYCSRPLQISYLPINKHRYTLHICICRFCVWMRASEIAYYEEKLIFLSVLRVWWRMPNEKLRYARFGLACYKKTDACVRMRWLNRRVFYISLNSEKKQKQRLYCTRLTTIAIETRFLRFSPANTFRLSFSPLLLSHVFSILPFRWFVFIP